MLISLYRIRDGGGRKHRVIFDRDGIVIQRTTVCATPRSAAEPKEIPIGEGSLPDTDRLVFESVKNGVQRGYIVLYGYVPAASYPLTSRYIRDFTGVAPEPDHIEGLPIWPRDRRRRGDRPTYLLFTVLSSVAK